ncbi:MAG: DUF805 domain-containing protein [Proteobacteria bacterium]|nr:DUF805 domain-containing protein [Pseudomonadota bacterium]
MATGFKHLNSTFKYIIPKFSGRLPYDDYSMAVMWCTCIALLPVIFALPVIPYMISMPTQELGNTLAVIVVISMIFLLFGGISSFSLCARRLHDTGRSGHWMWLSFCSLLSIIPAFFLLGDSVADNEFGPGTGKSDNRTFSDLKKALRDVFKPQENRLTYKEFALSCLVLSLISYAAVFILYFISAFGFMLFSLTSLSLSSPESLNNIMNDPGVITGLIVLGCIWAVVIAFFIILFVRLCILRLHDTGRSGLAFLWSIIPPIGVCVPLILIFCDTDDDNQWGPDKRKLVDSDDELGEASDYSSHYTSNYSSRDEIEE